MIKHRKNLGLTGFLFALLAMIAGSITPITISARTAEPREQAESDDAQEQAENDGANLQAGRVALARSSP